MDLMYIGLPLIALAWLVQLYFVFKGKKEIRPEFIVLYILGVLFLVAGDFTTGLTTLSYFELGTFLAALLVLIKIVKK